MKLTEDALCEIFADGIRDAPEFRQWFLSKTKFAQHANGCRLLHEEQMAIRPRSRWWRHWWCAVPELSKDRETDVFMVFVVTGTDKRFALHVENKRDNYKFNPGQAAAYAPRARHMLNRPDYLSHSDFQTVLLAPVAFRNRYAAEADLFDIFISYEEVARFIPQFAAATSN
jgi:hypothetical protein